MKRAGARLERPARARTDARELEQPARRPGGPPRAGGRGHKYAAQKVEIDGHKFDSKTEGRRYMALRVMFQAGEITEPELQPRFPIEVNGRPLCVRSKGFHKRGRQVVYVADFRYRVIRDGVPAETVVEDVKGLDTPQARLKRALCEHTYGIEITVLGGTYRSDKRRDR